MKEFQLKVMHVVVRLVVHLIAIKGIDPRKLHSIGIENVSV